MTIIKHKKKKDSPRITRLKNRMIDPTRVMNINFKMDTRLHKKLKTKALVNDESMTDIFIRAAEDYVAKGSS